MLLWTPHNLSHTNLHCTKPPSIQRYHCSNIPRYDPNVMIYIVDNLQSQRLKDFMFGAYPTPEWDHFILLESGVYVFPDTVYAMKSSHIRKIFCQKQSAVIFADSLVMSHIRILYRYDYHILRPVRFVFRFFFYRKDSLVLPDNYRKRPTCVLF